MSFEAIKQCAVRQDIQGLNRILGLNWGLFNYWVRPLFGISIDVRKPGPPYLTPAGELARENNLEAVEFLRQRGASVDYIALGFTLGDHLDQAQQYERDHNASALRATREVIEAALNAPNAQIRALENQQVIEQRLNQHAQHAQVIVQGVAQAAQNVAEPPRRTSRP